MTAAGRRWLMILLGLLALAPGLCSLASTPLGIGMMFGTDGLERGIGQLMLMCSAAGWAFVALMAFFIRRLRRAPVTEQPPKDETTA
jgi:TRAP-type C4-dicarboxylate transport system permease small subunit